MMSVIDDRVGSEPAGAWAAAARQVVHRVCTKNPFYVLSALLVLLGLWRSFGAQDGPEQAWALMVGMAVYTLLLAVPACLLVRYGGVWEDVRTVLLLVVLMFLATSVTFDATLARNPGLGIACFGAGLLFAVAVSEGMLRGMRLALPAGFRAPYYLILGLFFLYPVALVPLLEDPRSEALQWALLGFSPAAGLLFLTLLPAIRRGPDYVRDNGSPWRWPLYPWSLFVFLGFGVAARSFLLCWSMHHVARAEAEHVIFGPYFLVPMLFAVAVLVLELGLVAGHLVTQRLALLAPAGLVLLASIGHPPDDLYDGFLALVRARLGGTPFYLTVLASAGFYAYAARRRVPGALGMLMLALGALALVGPGTIDAHHLGPARPWPILAIAALQLGLGIARRDSGRCLIAAICLVVASLSYGPIPDALRWPLAYHLAIAAALGLGAAFDDDLGRSLRTWGALLAVPAALAVESGALARDAVGPLPAWALAAYPPLLAAILLAYAAALRHRPSGAVSALILGGWLAAFGWQGYSRLRIRVAGLDYLAAGLALLAVAELVSLAKAGLLARWLVAWRHGDAKPAGMLVPDADWTAVAPPPDLPEARA